MIEWNAVFIDLENILAWNFFFWGGGGSFFWLTHSEKKSKKEDNFLSSFIIHNFIRCSSSFLFYFLLLKLLVLQNGKGAFDLIQVDGRFGFLFLFRLPKKTCHLIAFDFSCFPSHSPSIPTSLSLSLFSNLRFWLETWNFRSFFSFSYLFGYVGWKKKKKNFPETIQNKKKNPALNIKYRFLLVAGEHFSYIFLLQVISFAFSKFSSLPKTRIHSCWPSFFLLLLLLLIRFSIFSFFGPIFFWPVFARSLHFLFPLYLYVSDA